MRTIKTALVCILVGIISVVMISRLAGIRPYIVMSGSMEPVIRTGSLCFVSPKADYDCISAGDIIAYRINGHLVTHRVIEVADEGMITKGDANALTDGMAVNRENYAGKTILAIPYIGYVVYALQQLLSPCLIIIAITIIAIYTYSDWGIKKTTERHGKRK